jgi:TRAP-type C4-dicarboxylate transport system permease small subunit
MLALITVEVFLRSIYGGGFAWTEEIIRFIFVWLMYFGFSYACRNNSHIKVTAVIGTMPVIIRKVILIVSDILFLGLAIYLFLATITVVKECFATNKMAGSLAISINWLYFAGVVGLALISIRGLQSIIWKISHFHDDIEKFENVGGRFFENDAIFFSPEAQEKKRGNS